MTINEISEKIERLESTIEEIVSRGHGLQDENGLLLFDESVEVETLHQSYDTQISDIQSSLDRLETSGLDKFVVDSDYRIGSEVIDSTVSVDERGEPQINLYTPHKIVDDIRWFLMRVRNLQSPEGLTSDYDSENRILKIGSANIIFKRNSKAVELLEIMSNLTVNTDEENLDICQKLYEGVDDLWSKEEKRVYWQRLSKICKRINERVRKETGKPELNYLICDYYTTKRII